MATLASGELSHLFEDFLKEAMDRTGAPIYRERVSQMISGGEKSLVVDFADLLKYNDDLANKVLQNPDSALSSFKTAAFETMRSENVLYADKIRRDLVVRIRGITDQIPLRKVDTSFLDKMLAVSGMVVRTSELRPLVVDAAWVCPNGHTTIQEQHDLQLEKPPRCELCGEVRNFELDRKQSRFIDFQIVRIQELPEELPPGQLPQFFDVNLEGDVVNTARPGDRVVLTGILRAVPDYSPGQLRMRLFRSQIDCNFVEVKGKEPEQIQITKQDEAMINSVAKAPDAYEKLIGSMAPAILGHEPEKEAILLLLVGGTTNILPDGTKLRGDINILLVGDPGCLAYDERVVLGDGAIVKIGQMGQQHLQPLNVQVLTGQGGGMRALATTFHQYRSQPIIEIVTESGKSIRGTPNHPLLRLRKYEGRTIREWCRLDSFRVGDRVAVVTGFPCTIKEYVRTNFSPIVRSKFGPKFHARLPDRMTPELAAFCGYVLGDGWVDKDGYRFGFVVAESELDILPHLLKMVQRLFGLEPKVSRRVRSDRKVPMSYVYLSNKDIAANLRFLREKRVPEMILQSGNEAVRSFLRWLYEADGTVFSHGRGRSAIGLKAKDIEFLRDVQMLLLRFGIHSRIVGNALLIRRGGDILKFTKSVGFVSGKKSRTLTELASLAKKFRRVHEQRSEKIVIVVAHPPADVYDIEVPTGHRFIANGVISHNTAKSELLKFTAQVAPRGLFASGRGTTAAGLSAAVIREKNVLMLEAGVVVLADQGIACLHPDTRVIFQDRFTTPAELSKEIRFEDAVSGGEKVEIGLLRGEVDSIDLSRLVMTRMPTTLVRRKMFHGKLKVLKFKTGNLLKVTPDHLLLEGSCLQWKPAAEFCPGQDVVAPLRLPAVSNPIWIWNIAPDDITVELSPSERAELSSVAQRRRLPEMVDSLQRRTRFRFGEIKTMVASLGIESEWRKRCLKFGTVRLRTSVVSPEMAYLVGFVFGDGFVTRRNGKVWATVSQSDIHAKYRARFTEAWKACFDSRLSMNSIASHSTIRGKEVVTRSKTWSVSKRIFYHIFRYLTEDNLSRILQLPNESLAGFVAGLMDSDGCMSDKTCTKQGRVYHNIDITFSPSNDERTNLNLATALRRFGCLGFVHDTKRRVFHVSLTSRRDVEHLREAIAKYSVKARKQVPGRREEMPGVSEMMPKSFTCGVVSRAYDGVPRQPLIDSGVWSTVHGYLQGVRAPRVSQVQKLLSRTGHLLSAESRERLELLLSRDYFLDQIVSVEEEDYEGYVYDLYVPNYHNFVAEGVIVENCIDEFDKMRAEDRSALHEQMEQQSVTIAKGGIYASLNARTAILAAMNPVLGKYNPFQNLTDNIGDVPIPLLTRFDLIFVIKDQPSLGEDEKLATHILTVHSRKTYAKPPPVEFGLLKKYISYAKKGTPVLTKEATDRLREYYLELRRSGGEEGQLPPTPRTLESLIRLATARSKLLLKDEVGEEDALAAVALMNRMVQDVLTDATTKKTDFGIQLGKPAGERKNIGRAIEVFKTLEGPDKKPVERRTFKEELLKAKFSDDDAEKMIRTMFREGLIYESKPGFFRRVNA